MGRSCGVLPYSRRPSPAVAVRRVAKEVERTHHSPVPEGTYSTAISSAVVSQTRSLRRGSEPVVLACRPHLVQHDCQLASQGDLCLAQAPALGQPNRPGFQGTPTLAVMDQHVGRLVKRPANGSVAGSTDPTGPIHFT